MATPRKKKAPERCSSCKRTDFVDAIDNLGQPYRGCAHCRIVVPEICAFVDERGNVIEYHEIADPHAVETVTLVYTNDVAKVFRRHVTRTMRGSTIYHGVEFRLVHVRYPGDRDAHVQA